MQRKNEAVMLLVRAVTDLTTAINRLDDKVERCTGMCECVMDEVVPLSQAIDQLLADAPMTMD